MLENTLATMAKERMRDPAQKQQVASAIMRMFDGLRKKPVADLEQRAEKMRQRVNLAVESMSVEFSRDELVVKVAGSAEALLNEFRRGSDWFQPEPDVDKIILAAMMVDPKRS